MSAKSDDDTYLNARQMLRRYGNCSFMWLRRRLQLDDSFPRPYFFGRQRYWKLAELERWEAGQANKPPPKKRRA